MNFIDSHHDAWHEVVADDALVAVPAVESHQLLSLAQWLAVRDAWPADTPVGLLVANDSAIEDWSTDVHRFAVVAVHFPTWTDGRAYSQAHLLRRRFGFAGEIRATGQVLVDMLPQLERCGVDAVKMRADQSRAVADRALAFFDGFYQGDALDNRPRFVRETRAGSADRSA